MNEEAMAHWGLSRQKNNIQNEGYNISDYNFACCFMGAKYGLVDSGKNIE